MTIEGHIGVISLDNTAKKSAVATAGEQGIMLPRKRRRFGEMVFLSK